MTVPEAESADTPRVAASISLVRRAARARFASLALRLGMKLVGRILSNFGFQYYLVVLDDYTHFLWTFPLRHKYDTFATLQNFIA